MINILKFFFKWYVICSNVVVIRVNKKAILSPPSEDGFNQIIIIISSDSNLIQFFTQTFNFFKKTIFNMFN